MSEGIIIALIGGVSAITAAIIGGEYALKAQKLSRQPPQLTKDSINPSNTKRSFFLMRFWWIISLVLFIASVFFSLKSCNKETSILASKWILLENNIRTGGITLEKKEGDKVFGFIVDGAQTEYKIEGIVVKDSLLGNIWLSNTSLPGKFRFLLDQNRTKLEGTFELGGITHNLQAQKAHFNATIANIPSPNQKIGFRNRILTDSELSIINSKRTGYGSINSRTLIGEISIGDSVLLLEEKGQYYKLAAIHQKRFRIGYISKKYRKMESLRR